MDNPFGSLSESVFADKGVLSEEYQPDSIPERDDEIELLRNALKDVLFGNPPQNVFVYGKTGVGKTVVTNYMTKALKEQARKRPEANDIRVLTHNCNGASAYSTVRSLVNDIRGPDEKKFPKRGLGTADALEAFYEELDDFGGTVLLVLDEIDHISDIDTLLYDIPRARKNGHLESAHVGIIGVSNDYGFRNRLSPKVRDTLMEREVSFSPYDAPELESILTERAKKALHDDAYDDSAIRLCAALAAKDTGAARQALDLLRTGGDIAEEEGATKITEEHIERARPRVRRGRLRTRIQDQTTHAQLVLEAVARLSSQGKTPARSKEIMPVYQNVARDYGLDPLESLKSVQNHLGDLTMLGFLSRSEKNDGRGGGLRYVYSLEIDAETVFKVRGEIDTN
jgi:orc1/cdc6 family replication initiation protein